MFSNYFFWAARDVVQPPCDTKKNQTKGESGENESNSNVRKNYSNDGKKIGRNRKKPQKKTKTIFHVEEFNKEEYDCFLPPGNETKHPKLV